MDCKTNIEEKVPHIYNPMKYCGTRWLENGKAIKRIMEIQPKIKMYFKFLNDRKKFPSKDDRFTGVQQQLGSPVFPAILEFSLCIINDIEPDLRLFQAERPLAIFLHERMHSLMLNMMRRFVRPEVLEENLSTAKMIKIDICDESKLLPTKSVNVGFGAKTMLKGLGTTNAPEVRDFYKNARQLLIRLIEKLRERDVH